jgi:pimeloyl-ACP methyl ester carboxylesterase
MSSPTTTNVVLVHGGFVDGSGWQPVYELLKRDGYRVSVVQNPTLSLDGDVEATRLILDRQDGPTILVGHSYGGAVISEAGNHPRVSALVYIAAFAPGQGRVRQHADRRPTARRAGATDPPSRQRLPLP